MNENDNKKVNVPVLQMTIDANPVSSLKSIVSSLYMEWLEDLVETELPQDVDFDSKEEYEKACKEFMVDLVDQAKEYKEDIFKGVLESYNQLLSNKYAFESEAKEKEAHSIEAIEEMTRDIKRTGIVVLALSFFVPSAFPYLILLNAPRVGIDVLARKRHNKFLESTKIVREQIESIQDPLYWFTDDLRTDYHKSNQELKELRERALNGENVIKELMELMSPERVKLPRENILKELEILVPDEQQEKSKQMIKGDNQ